MNYYLLKNNEKVGPFDVATIKAKLTQDEIGFFDQCWCEGMDEWQPIRDTIDLEGMEVPPPAPIAPPSPPTSLGDDSEQLKGRQPLNLIPALACASAATGLFILTEFAEYFDSETAAGVFELLGIIAYIATITFEMMLLYQFWKSVPEEHRVATPGKAVGFIFIPFYNFYWAFIAWPKLVDGLIEGGYKLPNHTRGLALTYAILFVCECTIGGIAELGDLPMISNLLMIGSLVIFILLYRELTKSVNLHREG